MKKVRLGSGSAFWGDMLEPAVELVEKGDIKYIGFDHLAELTLAIFQRIKAKDPTKGYIPDIIPWMKAILPGAWRNGCKVITNAGGANPEMGAEEVLKIARDLGMKGMKIGVVVGDDVSARLSELIDKGVKFPNLDSKEEDLSRIKDRIVAANAYIGSDSIIDALKEGAQVVVTGRVSDNALFVAPVMYEFGWDFSNKYIEEIASAITMGHMIECAECCTGGMSNIWQAVPEPWRIGFPVAEFYENGETIITKVADTGGLVNEWTIKEHLVYEVLDPNNYIMPDGIADFTSVKLKEVGQNRVKISRARGKARPKDLKLCIGYRDGFIGEAQIFFPWPDALEKAKRAAKIVEERLKIVKLRAEEVRYDFLGVNTILGETVPIKDLDYNEVGLRVAAKTQSQEEADKVRREITHLWTISSVGAHMGVPMQPRPVVSLWPTLIPREEVPTRVIMKEV
jgi:hypothetical protein